MKYQALALLIWIATIGLSFACLNGYGVPALTNLIISVLAGAGVNAGIMTIVNKKTST